MASVGQQWFIRNAGAGALQKIEVLQYHGGKVWTIREIGGVIPGCPMHVQEDTDFKFIQPYTDSASEKP